MKAFTVRMEDDTHRRLRILAARTGEPVQRMIARLLEAELRRSRRRTGKRGGR
ncbi:MAG TPA: hypothetical protein VI007_10245 [bacterium]